MGSRGNRTSFKAKLKADMVAAKTKKKTLTRVTQRLPIDEDGPSPAANPSLRKPLAPVQEPNDKVSHWLSDKRNDDSGYNSLDNSLAAAVEERKQGDNTKDTQDVEEGMAPGTSESKGPCTHEVECSCDKGAGIDTNNVSVSRKEPSHSSPIAKSQLGDNAQDMILLNRAVLSGMVQCKGSCAHGSECNNNCEGADLPTAPNILSEPSAETSLAVPMEKSETGDNRMDTLDTPILGIESHCGTGDSFPMSAATIQVLGISSLANTNFVPIGQKPIGVKEMVSHVSMSSGYNATAAPPCSQPTDQGDVSRIGTAPSSDVAQTPKGVDFNIVKRRLFDQPFDPEEGSLLFDCTLHVGSSSLDINSFEILNSVSDDNIVGSQTLPRVSPMRRQSESGENPPSASGSVANGGELSDPEEESRSVSHDLFDPSTTSTARKKQTRRYTPPDKVTKKRVSNPKKWKKNINKEKISRGEEYTLPNGKVIKGHSMQRPCDISCKQECSSKVSEEDRKKLYEYYWHKLATKESKWLYIQSHVSQFEKQNSEVLSRRKNSRKYFLPIKKDGKDLKIQVCKIMFLATFDISDGQVATAHKKVASSPNDKRGKNPHRPMPVNPALKESVRNHLKSLPKIPPHYVRENSQKEYLAGSIESVAQLHEMYEQWMNNNSSGVPHASYRQYNDIFNEEFNYAFFLSKKDSCDICTEYENSSEDRKAELQEDYDSHCRNKDLAQTMRLADQEVAKKPIAKNLAVVSFDYEKTLICPKAKESAFYYRRKLSVNNFTVVRVGKANEERCYVYDETIAKKGGNEVASLLYHFSVEKIELGVKEFRWYCDNCWGQNKNRGVTALMLTLVTRYENIRIVLRFLEKGHSYNAADTTHSVIEAKTRKVNIYTPEQWFQKMEEAKRAKDNKIIVIKVNQDMIYDFMELGGKLNLAKDENKQAVYFSKLREIVADSEEPHKLKVRQNLDSNEYQTICVKKVGKPVNFETYPLKSVYTRGPLPITKKKMDDLMYYCNKNLIPQEHQGFFRGLASQDADVSDNDDETIFLIEKGRGRPRKRRARLPVGKRNKKRREAEDEDDSEIEDDLFQDSE